MSPLPRSLGQTCTQPLISLSPPPFPGKDHMPPILSASAWRRPSVKPRDTCVSPGPGVWRHPSPTPTAPVLPDGPLGSQVGWEATLRPHRHPAAPPLPQQDFHTVPPTPVSQPIVSDDGSGSLCQLLILSLSGRLQRQGPRFPTFCPAAAESKAPPQVPGAGGLRDGRSLWCGPTNT